MLSARETSLAHGYNNWNIHNYCSSRICCQTKQHSCCFVSQYLSAVSFAGQTVFFSWANIVCINDLQEQTIVLASMNMFSNAVNAWWSILFYGADTAPEFKRLLGIACNRNRQYWCCCSDTSVAKPDKHQSHNDDGGVVAVVMDGEVRRG